MSKKQFIEQEENIFKKEQFNLKVAQRTFDACCEPKAKEYLALLPKKQPSEEERKAKAKNAFVKKSRAVASRSVSLDLSDLSSYI